MLEVTGAKSLHCRDDLDVFLIKYGHYAIDSVKILVGTWNAQFDAKKREGGFGLLLFPLSTGEHCEAEEGGVHRRGKTLYFTLKGRAALSS